MAMSATEAKASLISNRSMSPTGSPALAQTFSMAPTGASGKWSG